MKTYQPKAKEIKSAWHIVDAKDKVLGRLASDIAMLLTGKRKVTYSPHMDSGDYVVVINAKEVKLTGRKDKQKIYYSHSGYPGGFKETSFEKMIKDQPEKVIIKAVSGMLPKNRLQKKRLARMKVFADDKHPYAGKIENKQ